MSLIEHWGLEEDTIKEVGKFAILWGCFEWKYFDNDCKDKKIDQVVINDANQYLLTLCDEIIVTLKELYENNIQTIIERLRCDNKRDIIEKCIIDQNLDIYSKIRGTLHICYRIRNNMFHGEKRESSLNRQKNLFAKANNFLEELLILSVL